MLQIYIIASQFGYENLRSSVKYLRSSVKFTRYNLGQIPQSTQYHIYL